MNERLTAQHSQPSMNRIAKILLLASLSYTSCKSVDSVLPAPLGVSTFISQEEFQRQLGFEFHPREIAFSTSGDLYAVGNYQVVKITPTGKVSLFAGGTAGKTGYRNGPAAQALFDDLEGIAVNVSGDVFVGEKFKNCIRKISSNGTVSLFAGKPNWSLLPGWDGPDDGPDSSAHLTSPVALSFDKLGNLYETEQGGINRFSVAALRQISPVGYVRTIAGYVGDKDYGDFTKASSFGSPVGLAIGDSTTFFVTDADHGIVAKVNSNGAVTVLAGNGQKGFSDGVGPQAQFWSPTSLAYGPDKILYVGDRFSIRQVFADGQVKTLTGGLQNGHQDGKLSEGSFSYIYGLAFDSAGLLYVADVLNESIRRIRFN